MKDPDSRKYSRERKRPMRLQREARFSEVRITERSSEDDPAVERGERIAIGKMIARGGKSFGDVPGATSNSDHARHYVGK